MSGNRPNVWSSTSHDREFEEIEAFVTLLGKSIDATDFNRQFANDVVWGSPSGYVISGFDELHALHQRFFTGAMKTNLSRFTLVNLVLYDPCLAVVHVRRDAIDAEDRIIDPAAQPDPLIFHEIAMYVLVKRDGTWWLAAGQNTPIRANLLDRVVPPENMNSRELVPRVAA